MMRDMVWTDGHAAGRAESAAEIERLRRVVDAANAALAPFGKVGLDVLEKHPGWANDSFAGEWAGAYRLTYADFEHAAAVMIAIRLATSAT